MVAANEVLRVAMSSPEVSAAELIERARHADIDGRRLTEHRLARNPRVVWSALAGLTAAATFAVVLLMQPPALVPLPPLARSQPLVDAADYNLVVLPTRDPDLTILWFYKETKE